MDIFPLLSFSSVVTDIILRKVTPYELFAFSLHSEEATNIVKRFSSSEKFHMEIDLNCSRLIFNYEKEENEENEEDEEKNDLYLLTYPEYKPMKHILHFHGLNESVFAKIETDEDRTLVRTYWKKKEREHGLKSLIEYMASVFNNISISINFGVMARGKASRIKNWTEGLSDQLKKEQSELAKIMKDTIKKLKFNICSYIDVNDVHTFKELEQLISCKRLLVPECKLTKEELKKLFDKWMELENPGHITIGNNENFKLEDLSSENVIESEETMFGPTPYFEATRADGIKARIQLSSREFSFEVI